MKLGEFSDFAQLLRDDLEITVKGSAGTAAIAKAVHINYTRTTSDGDVDEQESILLELA